MIDIENAKKELEKYVSNYDINIGRIRLKYEHILKVVDNCEYIAKELGLDDEKVKLAMLIGIFHDFGRFEQVRLYDTFSDKETGIDHAKYSLQVLYEGGLIHNFINTNKYDNIIKKAVYYHNKKEIGVNVEGDELLFSKIIRDADKMDIYRVINQEKMEDIFWYKEFQDLYMSDKLMEQSLNHKLIDYNDIKNNADQIYTFFNYIYDFNFNCSIKRIQNNKYIEKFAKRIEETFKDRDIISKTRKLVDISNTYIKERACKKIP